MTEQTLNKYSSEDIVAFVSTWEKDHAMPMTLTEAIYCLAYENIELKKRIERLEEKVVPPVEQSPMKWCC